MPPVCWVPDKQVLFNRISVLRKLMIANEFLEHKKKVIILTKIRKLARHLCIKSGVNSDLLSKDRRLKKREFEQ